MLLHFDCVRLYSCVNISEGRKDGVHHLSKVSERVLEAAKFHCVDFLLSV